MLSRPTGLSSTTMPRPLLVPCLGWNDLMVMGHKSCFKWVMVQLCDGSHGSWITKDDPFPSLSCSPITIHVRQLLSTSNIDLLVYYLFLDVTEQPQTSAITYGHSTFQSVPPSPNKNQGCYWSPTGSHIRTFDWYQSQRPWWTFNGICALNYIRGPTMHHFRSPRQSLKLWMKIDPRYRQAKT